jgi:mono/diheme cytochrome c family protein
MRRLIVLAPVALLLAAGCIDGTETSATPENNVTISVPKAPVGDAAAGKVVFKGSAGCFGCHTLKDAGATGNVGPNLDAAKPDKAKILDRVVNGKSPMPAFKGQLTDKQIADVVEYVYSATHSS